MIELLFKELSELNEVEAIALGGSRAGENYDEKSDYDVYVYINSPIDEKNRKNILNNGIEIDILYRNMKDFMQDIENVAVKCQARNSYTTCMWHNLRTCKILYDENGNLTKYKEKYSFDYPEQLKKNIINHQLKLIDSSLPAYPNQIKKAIARGDLVSINHRISEFLASYFDMIFAINSLTHPGEKRLIQLCKKQCKILPENFEENLELLFSHMFSKENHLQCIEDIENIVKNLKKII